MGIERPFQIRMPRRPLRSKSFSAITRSSQLAIGALALAAGAATAALYQAMESGRFLATLLFGLLTMALVLLPVALKELAEWRPPVELLEEMGIDQLGSIDVSSTALRFEADPELLHSLHGIIVDDQEYRSVAGAIELAMIGRNAKSLFIADIAARAQRRNLTKSLSSSSSAAGHRTIGVDLSFSDIVSRQAARDSGLEDEPRVGLAEVIAKKSSIRDALVRSNDGLSSVLYVPAGRHVDSNDRPHLSPRLTETLRYLGDNSDRLIISGGSAIGSDEELVPACFTDCILILARRSECSERVLREAIRSLAKTNTPILGICFVEDRSIQLTRPKPIDRLDVVEEPVTDLPTSATLVDNSEVAEHSLRENSLDHIDTDDNDSDHNDTDRNDTDHNDTDHNDTDHNTDGANQGEESAEAGQANDLDRSEETPAIDAAGETSELGKNEKEPDTDEAAEVDDLSESKVAAPAKTAEDLDRPKTTNSIDPTNEADDAYRLEETANTDPEQTVDIDLSRIDDAANIGSEQTVDVDQAEEVSSNVTQGATGTSDQSEAAVPDGVFGMPSDAPSPPPIDDIVFEDESSGILASHESDQSYIDKPKRSLKRLLSWRKLTIDQPFANRSRPIETRPTPIAKPLGIPVEESGSSLFGDDRGDDQDRLLRQTLEIEPLGLDPFDRDPVELSSIDLATADLDTDDPQIDDLSAQNENPEVGEPAVLSVDSDDLGVDETPTVKIEWFEKSDT